MMQQILKAKLSKAPEQASSAAPPPPSDPKGDLMSQLRRASKENLRKVEPMPERDPVEDTAANPFLDELRRRSQSAMEARQESYATNGLDVVMEESAGAPPPPPAFEASPLVQEIQSTKLLKTESMHKISVPPTLVPPVKQSATPAAPAPAAMPTPTPPSEAVSGGADGDGQRPIAPRVDALGKPIPEWKRKILQRKLDAEWDKKQKALMEERAKEARWIGVPQWKRAMMERKEADAARKARGEVIEEKPSPAPAAEPSSGPPNFKAVLKKSSHSVRTTPAPAAPPPAAPPPAAPTPAATSPQPKFDPFTGKPLAPTTTPAQPTPRFDPMTGKPLAAATANTTATPPASTGFSRSTQPAAPSAPPQNPPSDNAVPLQQWKLALLEKKKKQEQDRIDQLRKEKEAAEARWIGVPAWKRKIIEEKERALGKR